MLYSGGTYLERRRAVKRSKYLASPYDEAICNALVVILLFLVDFKYVI